MKNVRRRTQNSTLAGYDASGIRFSRNVQSLAFRYYMCIESELNLAESLSSRGQLTEKNYLHSLGAI